MLTGKRAFRGDSAVETMNAILKEDPPELSQSNQNIAPALERVVDHCLQKNPEERFQSARDQFLIAADSTPAYAPPGYLLFLRERTLMAQPFNADKLQHVRRRQSQDAF